MTKEQLKNKLMKNADGDFDTEIYWHNAKQLTEDFVREMKEYINFDELFESRHSLTYRPDFSMDFYRELKDNENFGQWMAKESGLATYIKSDPDCSLLKPAILDAFKEDIMKYAKSLDDNYVKWSNDYAYFFDVQYDDEMKAWLKREDDLTALI